MNDQELDRFLKSLRAEQPTAEQVAKWQAAVQAELQPRRRTSVRWIELTAAVLVGVLIGGVMFHSKPTPTEEISADNATIEYIVTKSN